MSKHEAPPFALSIPEKKIAQLSWKYPYISEERAATEAGSRIKLGDYRKVNLEPIFEWKVKTQGKHLRADNLQSDVADALCLASYARTERSAIAVLTGLRGVGVPVASAILTAMYPDRYTIIDWRTIASLGQNEEIYTYGTVPYYLFYLSFCRKEAYRLGIDLRTLDRALWQGSSDVTRRDHRAARGNNSN